MNELLDVTESMGLAPRFKKKTAMTVHNTRSNGVPNSRFQHTIDKANNIGKRE